MADLINWSKNYISCINCGTADHKHKAKGLCTYCYQLLHKYPNEPCLQCGVIARVHKRLNGSPICKSCYERPKNNCVICNKNSHSALRTNTSDYICVSCYNKYYRTKYLCEICGKLEILAINNEENKICIKCYSPTNQCSLCGRNIKSLYKHNHENICARCYEKNRLNQVNLIDINTREYVCSVCGKINNVQRIYNDGSVICSNCFKLKSNICTLCNNMQNQIHSHIKGLPYCRDCYYKMKIALLINNRLWHDSFQKIFNEYLNDMMFKKKPESVFRLIIPNLSMLDCLESTYRNNKLSLINADFLSLLNKFSESKMMLHDLSLFMLDKSMIDNFDINIKLFEGLAKSINDLPHELTQVLLLYKEHLNKLVKAYSEKGWSGKDTRFSYYTCYLYFQSCIRFSMTVSKLKDIKSFRQMDNNIVEAYLGIKPYERNNLSHFIRFLNDDRLVFRKLTINRLYNRSNFPLGVDELIQIRILKRCLEDSSISLRDKTLVLLMQIYGIRVEELKLVKKSQFHINEKNNYLIFDYNDVAHRLPAVVSPIIQEYLSSIKNEFGILFPGRYYNQALSITAVHKILKRFSVTATQLRYTAINNAMTNGIFQPSLLMKLFKIQAITAVKYYNFIKGSTEC
ncbi:MAG TPA: hypothetical protein VEB00_01675 [Clostridia bacterium]|nr:hypothetical protein [Clostridia bacterium]